MADALEPIFTELVNAGYGDGLGEEGNEAIPLDPTKPRPMQPGSSLGNLGDVPGTLQTGLDAGVKDAGLKTAQETAQDDLDAGVKTAQDDLSNPTNVVTKPLGEVGKLPVLGSLAPPNSTLTTNKLSTTGGNLFAPGSKKPASTASPGGANPVNDVNSPTESMTQSTS